jgi:hypothetical protein
MANDEHCAILRQGVEAWNRWRYQNPGVRPDLSGLQLENSILREKMLDSFSNAAPEPERNPAQRSVGGGAVADAAA